MTQKSEKAFQEWIQEAEQFKEDAARRRADVDLKAFKKCLQTNYQFDPHFRREESLPWAFCALLIGTLGFTCWLVLFWLLKTILE